MDALFLMALLPALSDIATKCSAPVPSGCWKCIHEASIDGAWQGLQHCALRSSFVVSYHVFLASPCLKACTYVVALVPSC